MLRSFISQPDMVSFVAIDTEKITILGTKLIKLKWEIVLKKPKNSARRRHCTIVALLLEVCRELFCRLIQI